MKHPLAPELIEKLVADLRPRPWYVRRRIRIAAWLIIATVFTLVGFVFCPGPPIRTMLSVGFVLQTASLFGLGTLLGMIAILSSLPGEPIPTVAWKAIAALTTVAFSGIVLLDPELGLSWGRLVEHRDEILICAHAILWWSSLPTALGLLLVNLGAALRTAFASTLMCLGTGMLAAAILQVECVNRSALHVLFGHLAPVLLLTCGVCLLVSLVSRWRLRVLQLKARLSAPD